jgi:hypothetical protein
MARTCAFAYTVRLAIARTRASKAGDRKGVLTVWNGFSDALNVQR